jgi:hypothetical protein
MNIDKLTEAIQIIVREEIKRVLPKVVKKSIQLEVNRILSEQKNTLNNKSNLINDVSSVKSNIPRDNKRLSKDPMFNKILNETKPFDSKHRVDDGGFRTMNFDSNDVHTLGMGSMMDDIPDMNNSHSTGLGVSTGNSVLDKVFNRDYSALVKAMDKKK